MAVKRLHLGSGGLVLPGWINTDIDEGDGVDFALDASKVPYPFEDNSLDEILSAHMVEHINRDLVLPMIKEWRRILKPGCRAIAEIPDLGWACKIFLESHDDKQRENAMRIFYGLYEERETQGHKWGYTYETIKPLFIQAGFTYVEETPTQDYHWHNCGIKTFRVEAVKI